MRALYFFPFQHNDYERLKSSKRIGNRTVNYHQEDSIIDKYHNI